MIDKSDVVTLIGLGLLFWGTHYVSMALAFSAVGLVLLAFAFTGFLRK